MVLLVTTSLRVYQVVSGGGVSEPAELPSPESIAAAAADMTVRDSAGDSLLTRACAKRRLDWVELLSPQVKQCDLQSVGDGIQFSRTSLVLISISIFMANSQD